jgi:RNA polymerase sigma-70 factor (ECF subfamily)
MEYSITLLCSEKGFKQVYEAYYPRLLRFAETYVHDKYDAEDIVQDVFYRLWRTRESFQKEVNITSVLLTLTKSHCIDFLRHKQVMEQYAAEKMMTEAEELEFNYHAVSMFEPEQINIETLELLVKEIIDGLPGQCRKVFELSRYDGLSYKEIATKLSLSVKTVESHISHALSILREKLSFLNK